MSNPYDEMPKKDGMTYAPGNLQAAIMIARWKRSGEPDFWEWMKKQRRLNE